MLSAQSDNWTNFSIWDTKPVKKGASLFHIQQRVFMDIENGIFCPHFRRDLKKDLYCPYKPTIQPISQSGAVKPFKNGISHFIYSRGTFLFSSSAPDTEVKKLSCCHRLATTTIFLGEGGNNLPSPISYIVEGLFVQQYEFLWERQKTCLLSSFDDNRKFSCFSRGKGAIFYPFPCHIQQRDCFRSGV